MGLDLDFVGNTFTHIHHHNYFTKETPTTIIMSFAVKIMSVIPPNLD